MIHLVRLDALEGSADRFEADMQRLIELNPSSERRVPLLSLKAFVTGDPDEQRAALASLGGSPDLVVSQTGYETSLYARNFTAARQAYQILAAPDRAPEIRAFGHIMQAYLSVASGRWHEARKELAVAAQLNPAMALEHSAYLRTALFLPVSDNELLEFRDRMEAFDADAVPRNVRASLNVQVHDTAHHHIRLFLLGVLSARLGEHDRAEGYASELEGLPQPAGSSTLPRDLAICIRGWNSYVRGDMFAALEAIERVEHDGKANYIYVLSSPFYSHGFERYMKAKALESLGRYEQALRDFASFDSYSVYELIHVAPGLLAQAAILERLGRNDEAADRLERFVGLWADCDPQFQRTLQEARASLKRLGR